MMNVNITTRMESNGTASHTDNSTLEDRDKSTTTSAFEGHTSNNVGGSSSRLTSEATTSLFGEETSLVLESSTTDEPFGLDHNQWSNTSLTSSDSGTEGSRDLSTVSTFDASWTDQALVEHDVDFSGSSVSRVASSAEAGDSVPFTQPDDSRGGEIVSDMNWTANATLSSLHQNNTSDSGNPGTTPSTTLWQTDVTSGDGVTGYNTTRSHSGFQTVTASSGSDTKNDTYGFGLHNSTSSVSGFHNLTSSGIDFHSVSPSSGVNFSDANSSSGWDFDNVTSSFSCLFASSSNSSLCNVTDGVIAASPTSELYDVMADDDVSVAVTTAKAATLVLLAVTGVVGNALVIWSVVRQRHLHRPPFYYLLSLSLTDLSRAAFCLPLVLMTVVQGSVWRHGDSACNLFAFANSFFVLSSGVSLLDIAADRHVSLIYPRAYRRRAGGAVNLLVVLLVWTIAFLVAFPPVVGVGAYAFESSEGQCTLRHKFFRDNNDTLGFLMVFSTLSLLTLFLYYRVLLALRSHRRMRPLEHEPARSATWTFVGPGSNGQAFINWMNGFGGSNVGPTMPNLPRNPPRPNLARVVNLHVARNQHVIRLFFLMTVAFNVLWLPYQVLSYWRVFGSGQDIHVVFVTCAAWLSYGQVAVCPLVYFTCRGHSSRRRVSRADVTPDDKQEFLLESFHRKK